MGITPTRAEAARIQKACARIGPNSLLRVTFTDKARIEGYTSLADDAGLHALQPKLAHGPLPPLPDVVPWTRIFEVEKRGGSAGSFAIKGALYMGLMGAMIGAAAGAASDAAPSAPVAGAAIGAAVSGAIGAGLGALIGAPIPRWHVVY